MTKSRGIATITIMALIFTGCVVATFVAEKYLSPKEAAEVEDVSEEIAEMEVELAFHQPKGSLKEEVDSVFPKQA